MHNSETSSFRSDISLRLDSPQAESGFVELESDATTYVDGFYRYDLRAYKAIEKLVFRPISHQCMLDVEMVRVLLGDGSYKFINFKSNAIWGEEGQLIFDNIQPLITLEVDAMKDDIEFLDIRIHYRLTDISTLKLITGFLYSSGRYYKPAKQVPYKKVVELIKNIHAEKKQIIHERVEQIKHKSYLNYLRTKKEVDSHKKELEVIKNSRSYKLGFAITSPIRYFFGSRNA